MIVLLTLCSVVGVVSVTVGTSNRSPSLLLSRPLIVSDRTQPLPLPREIVDGITVNLPRPKDLNPNKLQRRLQSEFDPQWMSVDAPSPDDGSEVELNPVHSETPAWLLNELRNLNLSHVPNNVAGLSATTISALEVWLLERASCPVRYEWVDIGPLFWPPWVKHGTCVARQCSWPSGMSCVPGETNTITLLRWHCRSASLEEDDRSSKKRNKCRWLKVPYPIISECVCTCDQGT
ncbi:noggin-like [Acanthaster planci]|uniref:Noggin-like n=1 Tax=Acanthaster planci TaxID=133434 RepID=A0A8B7XHE1_ACAPL|nr:noggin-like [Acanthaster planci]